MVYITHFWKTIEQMVYVHPSWNMLGITAWLAHPLYKKGITPSGPVADPCLVGEGIHKGVAQVDTLAMRCDASETPTCW